jgi:hypothetical protein
MGRFNEQTNEEKTADENRVLDLISQNPRISLASIATARCSVNMGFLRRFDVPLSRDDRIGTVPVRFQASRMASNVNGMA